MIEWGVTLFLWLIKCIGDPMVKAIGRKVLCVTGRYPSPVVVGQTIIGP